MADPTARLLALLGVLQTGSERSGSELAERLGVSARTIRHDVERLRALGYPVEAKRGSIGGYRLGAGGSLPPLLLDDEEAVAVTIALRAAAGISGVAESGTRALAKLEQVLPSHLRPTVDALRSSVDRAPENNDTDAPDPEVDAAALQAIASAIRHEEWLRFDYDEEPVLVEPYRLLTWHRRWYLVGRDPQSGEWGTYRVDWMALRMPTHRRFDPQPLPGGDYTAFAMRTIAVSGWVVHARLRIDAPAAAVLDRIHAAVGVVEPVDDEHCILVTGADTLDTVAAYIGMLMMDFTVESPPELIPRLQLLSERYARAVSGS